MKKTNSVYHIALAFDSHEKYSLVLIKNIIDLTNKDELYFHIFLSNKTNYIAERNRLDEWGINHNLYVIDLDILENLQIDNKIYPWINNAAFYRLLIPEMMPKNIDAFLYLDTDVWVNFDIRGIFQYLDANYPIVVCSTGKGFNSGVMLIHREKFIQSLPFTKSKRLIIDNHHAGDNEFLISYFDTLDRYIGLEYNYPVMLHSISSEYLGSYLNYPFGFLKRLSKSTFQNKDLS